MVDDLQQVMTANAKLAQVKSDFDRWRELSLSLDYS